MRRIYIYLINGSMNEYDRSINFSNKVLEHMRLRNVSAIEFIESGMTTLYPLNSILKIEIKPIKNNKIDYDLSKFKEFTKEENVKFNFKGD